jgi:hypothetical protein
MLAPECRNEIRGADSNDSTSFVGGQVSHLRFPPERLESRHRQMAPSLDQELTASLPDSIESGESAA